MKRVVVFAPHTDDGEIGCGGTLVKFLEQGGEVFYVAFSTARSSVVENGYPENILEIEVKEAMQVMGIPQGQLLLFDFPVRRFPEFRQDILSEMIKIKGELRPDLIFVPSLHDIHQDHQVVAMEGLRAFKRHTILGYEEPWNNIVFESRCFVSLEKWHIERKIEALKCYRSQLRRSYLSEEAIWGMANLRGAQLEGGYAEAFEVLRWIVEV